ncbi:uncharacterized protein LOC131218973 isoform X2 [Magnolia sinica]|uniref:uncharacterized protein LOC131218973 isoform X2 n=1 Tax=Magnolia sinica TaxID=86752 RepID=UPI002658C64D|nr:uncharacterized protein LOC131218973 isoform X2 [Magnolia sinica]
MRTKLMLDSCDAKNNHLVTSLLLSSGFWSDYLSSMGTGAIRGLPKWLFTTVQDSLGLTYDVSFELSQFDRLKLRWYVVSVTSTPGKVYKAVVLMHVRMF